MWKTGAQKTHALPSAQPPAPKPPPLHTNNTRMRKPSGYQTSSKTAHGSGREWERVGKWGRRVVLLACLVLQTNRTERPLPTLPDTHRQGTRDKMLLSPERGACGCGRAGRRGCVLGVS